jgi:Pyruvate/2-oxoacid:ferredoxin oxidoreductase gamma subunit
LIVQYPGRHRPRIEQGTPFFGHGPIPISSTNIRLTVGGKMGERLREIADDPIETAKFIAELATEEGALGLIDGILMVGAAWGAATVGTGIDLWLKHLLKRKQKRLSSPPKSLL